MTEPLPGFIEKRAILYGKNPLEKISTGEAFQDQGYFDDALDFFIEAKDTDRITALAEETANSGDPFILMRIERFQKKPLPQELWDKVLKKAAEEGKNSLVASAENYLAARFFS